MRGDRFFRIKDYKKIYTILFLIGIINLAISFGIKPVKNTLVSDDILTIDSLTSGNYDYVQCEEKQIIYNEATETCVAYAYIDVNGYDYLQVDLDAYAVNDQCQVYVDISGENSKWDTIDNFYSEFYSTVDVNNTHVSGKLELGRNSFNMGVIRIMNGAGEPVNVSNIHVSGWKYYKLSNYSILMLIIFSLLIICVMQKAIINNDFIFSYYLEIIISFVSVNALFGGLVNDIARSSNSLSAMFNTISEFLVSDSQYTWIITAFFILYVYVALQMKNEYLHNYSVVSSYIFSFFVLSGYLYKTNNVFFELYHQKHFWLECLFMIVGLALFIQCVMKILHILIVYLVEHSGTLKCSRKKCFRIVWLIVTMVWIPHLLIRYPASIHWDSAVQINQVLYDSIDTSWPAVSTLLMGKSTQLGNLIFGSFNIGIFFYTLIQTIICSFIFAYGISLLIEFNVSRIYVWIATFICSCLPVFSSFTTSVSKDVPFSNLVMLFLLMLLETIKVKRDVSLKYGLSYVCVTVFVILISNKGVFYVLVSVIGIIVFGMIKKEKKYWKLLAVMMISLLSARLVQVEINRIYGDTSTLNVTICQPLQEIGYYAINYEDELSNADKELLDQFVIYEDIADSYNMDMADGMFKGVWRFENEHSAKELFQFILLWFRCFRKHPDCYIDATIRCNFGFYYPDTKQWGNYNSGYYIGDPNVPNTKLPFKYPEILQSLNKKLSKIILVLEDVPVLYLFSNVAISVWVQIFIFLYMLFQKKWEDMFCILVAMVSFVLCLIGPTYYCGGARYALVSVFSNVFIVGYWINDRYK